MMSFDNQRGKHLGNYVLEDLIGQGGMGSVYIARQETPGRQVAVKILHTSFGQTSGQFGVRFRREADLIAKLDHVNIIPLYEYAEKEGLAYLVMPLVTGGSLRDLLSQRGHFTLKETIAYLQQAAGALDYAHQHGIIHRDLKPANFLLHADGRLILADFGIAHLLENSEQLDTRTSLTTTGAFIGTPEYMAPEMVRGESVDCRTDIYALGIILYQMLSGELPFRGNTPMFVAAMHLHQSLPLLHIDHAGISPEVDTVIQKATAKMPAERYQSARAMVQDLLRASTAKNGTAIVSTSEPTLYATTAPSLLLPASAQQTPVTVAAPNAENHTNNKPFSRPGETYPPQPFTTPVQKWSKRSFLFWFALYMLVFLIIGSLWTILQINHNTSINSTQETVIVSQPTTQPTSDYTASNQQTPSPSITKTTAPNNYAGITYPSINNAEQDISYYYTNESDFKGKNIIQHFDSLTYGSLIGPSDQPQFIACAEYTFAYVNSPTVTQDTARHTFTFQYSSSTWSVIDMGNWASC
jgi:serine/threonine protein kinase